MQAHGRENHQGRLDFEGRMTMEEQLQELRARLERAEQEVRALRLAAQRMGRQTRVGRAVTLALLVGGATFALTRPAATQLRAQAAMQGGTRVVAPFVVVDNQNNPLLQVSAAPGGGGLLAVLDQVGNPIGLVGTVSDGRGLAIFDSKGQFIAKLGEDPMHGNRGLRLLDPDGKVTVGAGLAPDGRGLRVLDSADNTVAGLGITADGRGLTIFDEGRQAILHMGEDPGHTTRGLGITNAAGKYVAGLTAGANHGQLTLGANDGTVLFNQPSP
jgi:hypothetical protein